MIPTADTSTLPPPLALPDHVRINSDSTVLATIDQPQVTLAIWQRPSPLPAPDLTDFPTIRFAAATHSVAAAVRDALGTPPLQPESLLAEPELPLHAGVDLWISRRQPLLTSGDLEWIESLRSLLASLGVAAFFAWRWWRGRAQDRFEPWFAQVAALEARALAIETAPGPLDLPEIVRLRRALGEAKAEVLRRHADGRLDAPEQLSTFLALVSDARQMMDGLLLHARGDGAEGVGPAE